MTSVNDNIEDRVLIFMPTGRDGGLVSESLSNLGFNAQACQSLEDFKLGLQLGAGAVLIAEEALHGGVLSFLAEFSGSEPVWSDMPIVLFAGSSKNAERLLSTVGSQFNATIVERPIRIAMLVSAVRGALRARTRQYQTRDLLAQLKEADKHKDLFLATLSHELRTPLNSILGWIQLMRGGDGGQVDMKRALDVIERNAKSQSELISDILFTSRVISGKLEVDQLPISLTAVVQAAIETIRPLAQEKSISLTFTGSAADTGAGDIADIKGDFDRLQQAFWNLLSNAVKFTPENGAIEVSIERTSQGLAVAVKDSGRGIDPEFLPHVFERFRQADSSYSRNIGGLGLGLAIVRHLVEMHGGSVSVASDGHGRGAVFTVVLPSIAEAERLRISPAANDEVSGADLKSLDNVRILLVEDDEDSREMLAANFGFYGFDVKTAASAPEALEAFKKFHPDIIVSDVGLPGEDGYSLMRKIRALPEAAVPAIALTGYVSTQDQAAAREAGYQEHLSKPVDIGELAKLVDRLLSERLSSVP